MIKKRQSKPTVHSICAGFSLIELLVAVFVVTIMVLILGQLMGHATTVTRTGNSHIDTDTQARVILDRMAIDIAQMLKRTDIDYYVKGSGGYTGHGNGHAYGHKVSSGQQGSDQIAFFSQVPGYNSTSYSSTSPLSLIAYRINSLSASPAYLRMERMGKGLLWNGTFNSTVSNPNNKNSRSIWYPIIFAPGQIGAVGGPTGPWATPWGPWAAAITNDTSGNLNNSGSQDADYEVIGPNVFRFEYYYLLKNGLITDVPWDQDARPSQTSLTSPTSIGLVDVEAIGVAIAVIDPANRALIDATSSSGLYDIASDFADFKSAQGRGVGAQKKVGDLEADWETSLSAIIANGKTSTNTVIPKAAVSAIRIYGRYFNLKTLPAF
jgi:prepilin-type N-terminal cleavage/methylation domain-containing protein